ncbi:MAG: hypothetical protein MRY49_01885 [Candidatus Pacebacteria bacterium]|nr:hypothetical protein [Candidatus Paceibacterota bacterium]
MAKTMTTSKQKPMTDGQIEDLVGKFRDAVRKHRDELGSEAVQYVLGTDNLGMVLFDPFRKLVEMMNAISICNVTGVNRTQSPQDALDATGRKQYTTQSVVDSMPRGGGENVELKFFELDYNPSTNELDAEYKRRGLRADPIALCKYMEVNPTFADERPVACQWGLGKGGAAFHASFYRWSLDRSVRVFCSDDQWDRFFRFAGVSK